MFSKAKRLERGNEVSSSFWYAGRNLGHCADQNAGAKPAPSMRNLVETIAALQSNDGREQQTVATVGSEMKLLQPAQLPRRSSSMRMVRKGYFGGATVVARWPTVGRTSDADISL